MLSPGSLNPMGFSGLIRCPVSWANWFPTVWNGNSVKTWAQMDDTLCATPDNGYGSMV